MEDAWSRLQKAFLEDHRAIVRGYESLMDLLNQRDFTGAAREASRLDTVAGPHIEFEEKYLYPEVERARGTEFKLRLCHEHDDVLSAITELQQISPDNPPPPETVASWKTRIRAGIDHASACGSLLSQLKSRTPEEHLQFLDGLTRLREKGARWTELTPLPANKE